MRAAGAEAEAPPAAPVARMVEWTIESRKTYADPFNDVDVDVIFSKDDQFWRVPTFWRGGQRWTVRFAPPSPGQYTYRLQSTDAANPDLNGQEGRVTITRYEGPNELLRHGMLRVSANKRYFEHADGTPFYWLGDTWWTGLSDRLSWSGFQTLAADRKAKGFTVVQIVAGLVPEEFAPLDPGCRNEGGSVWEAGFARINPGYFDYADRRIGHLLDSGMVPALVGAWNRVLGEMGPAKMKQHWRYLIARYGAYPVFWIVGGEVFDPPDDVARRIPTGDSTRREIMPGWTDVARFIRSTDPYRHPLSVHERPPPTDFPLRDETLTDFDLVQSGHIGWQTTAVSVAQLNMHYARKDQVKPVVQGEIGYEKLGETHFEDFQRNAFWLSMLNGAAGHTYGAVGVWEAYTADKPLHRSRWSYLSWQEGMNLPGSYQVGLSAKLLRQQAWWRFEPHPEWITPHGTTLLKPREGLAGSDLGFWELYEQRTSDTDLSWYDRYPAGEWRAEGGDFHLPYAAGIPREVRMVYLPGFGLSQRTPPTVLGLETGVRYHASFWQPSLGVRVDLGIVARPPPGELILTASPAEMRSPRWTEERVNDTAARRKGARNSRGDTLSRLEDLHEKDVVAAVELRGNAPAALVLRYQDVNNYILAAYSPEEKAIYMLERRNGADGPRLGLTPVPALDGAPRLSAEVRTDKVAVSISDDRHTYTTPIVGIANTNAGSAGVLYGRKGGLRNLATFELRHSPTLVEDAHLERRLFDARGEFRGELVGASTHPDIPGWDRFGRDKHILLDAYLPETLPTAGDWLLVLDAAQKSTAPQEITSLR